MERTKSEAAASESSVVDVVVDVVVDFVVEVVMNVVVDVVVDVVVNVVVDAWWLDGCMMELGLTKKYSKLRSNSKGDAVITRQAQTSKRGGSTFLVASSC